MKLLFDENLSPELVDKLADCYPGSQHVHEHGLGAADDGKLWKYAESYGLVIVTKDADFYELSLRAGAPPKVVWIRLGNCRTAAVEMLLRNSEQALLWFAEEDETCLVLGRR